MDFSKYRSKPLSWWLQTPLYGARIIYRKRDNGLLPYQRAASKKEVRLWKQVGCPAPPPHAVKIYNLLKLRRQENLGVFVETGTYLGETIEAIMPHVRAVYSVELAPGLYEAAQEKFAGCPSITILQGDSTHVLPEILKLINEPALFWLDAHPSDETTARGELVTPIVRELEIIAGHDIKNHAVIIDDARGFVGENDYPTVEEVRQQAARLFPKHTFTLQDDAMQIVPAKAGRAKR